MAIIAAPNPDKPPYRLTLMPGARLAELQRVVEGSSGQSIAIRLRGLIYVYREKNYLLLTQVTVVNDIVTRPESEPTTRNERPTVAEGASRSQESAGERFLQELDERAGQRVSSAAGAGEHLNRPLDGSARNTKTLREGVVITNRRGKLSRDASGAWVFVFDADAHGLADPPMKILPCLLLERMEEYARRVGSNAPAILNGTVYLYGGQNYLLPTVFLIPQDRRNITP
jgi:hypothetical protein